MGGGWDGEREGSVRANGRRGESKDAAFSAIDKVISVKIVHRGMRTEETEEARDAPKETSGEC
jgi:hypothetical protein